MNEKLWNNLLNVKDPEDASKRYGPRERLKFRVVDDYKLY